MFGVVVDSPARNSAMVDKLWLPFPLLSDPDRSQAIDPFDVANPTDKRKIARPAIVIVTPGQEEAWRWESRDYADRIPEEDVLAALAELDLPPTTQAAPTVSDPQPGPRAMPLHQLGAYFRGARFAAVALGARHPAVADDTAAYVEEMDRFLRALSSLKGRQAGAADQTSSEA